MDFLDLGVNLVAMVQSLMVKLEPKDDQDLLVSLVCHLYSYYYNSYNIFLASIFF